MTATIRVATAFEVRDVPQTELPWPLLLEADPHKPHVETYLRRSLWVGLYEHERLLAVAALSPRDTATIELMSIAVDPVRRRQGLGRFLMQRLIARARAMGAQRVVVGTGNSSLVELRFYQRMGFRMKAIDPDYFVRVYPAPIFEDGIACRDRILLHLSIGQAA